MANLKRTPQVGAPLSHGLGLFGGMGALFEAIGFVVATPAVWPFAIVPVIVGFVLVSGCAALGIWGAIAFADHLLVGSTGALATVGAWILKIFLCALALLLGAVVAMALAQPLSSFALERIARMQEKRLGGRDWPEDKFFPSLVRSVAVTFTGLLLGLPVLAVLFIITFFVPPASVVTVPLKFVVTALLIAWDFLDYPLSVRGMSVGARLRFVLDHFWAVFGFGLASGMLLLVPGIGLLLLPIGVAGAARLVVREEHLALMR